jgi:hypothetical protein
MARFLTLFIPLLFGGCMPCIIRGSFGPTDIGYIVATCIAYPLGYFGGSLK